MSAALQILGNAADALAAGHDEPLTLMPANLAVTGYAEDVPLDPATRGSRRHPLLMLHLASEPFTHLLHIRRGKLSGVDLSKVDYITHPASGKRYRALHWSDDPMSPTVDWACLLV